MFKVIISALVCALVCGATDVGSRVAAAKEFAANAGRRPVVRAAAQNLRGNQAVSTMAEEMVPGTTPGMYTVTTQHSNDANSHCSGPPSGFRAERVGLCLPGNGVNYKQECWTDNQQYRYSEFDLADTTCIGTPSSSQFAYQPNTCAGGEVVYCEADSQFLKSWTGQAVGLIFRTDETEFEMKNAIMLLALGDLNVVHNLAKGVHDVCPPMGSCAPTNPKAKSYVDMAKSFDTGVITSYTHKNGAGKATPYDYTMPWDTAPNTMTTRYLVDGWYEEQDWTM